VGLARLGQGGVAAAVEVRARIGLLEIGGRESSWPRHWSPRADFDTSRAG